jgi:hypothetical protein
MTYVAIEAGFHNAVIVLDRNVRRVERPELRDGDGPDHDTGSKKGQAENLCGHRVGTQPTDTEEADEDGETNSAQVRYHDGQRREAIRVTRRSMAAIKDDEAVDEQPEAQHPNIEDAQ